MAAYFHIVLKGAGPLPTPEAVGIMALRQYGLVPTPFRSFARVKLSPESGHFLESSLSIQMVEGSSMGLPYAA